MQESSHARQMVNCDRSHYFYDICSINGSTILDPSITTFFLQDSTASARPYIAEKIRPYPRKWENLTMARIKEVTVTSGPESPPCETQHNAPALLFSAGGYTGNFFHDFNDGFIPLFITVNSIFPNQDFVLVISKARDWWVRRYADLLQAFSNRPIVNLDNDTSTHCFTSATLGLISHGFMTINPQLMPNPKDFGHFRSLLDRAYGHCGRRSQPSISSSSKYRPRLVLVGRKGGVGRVILNQEEVRREVEKMGFDVVLFEPTPGMPLHAAYELINSSHAMVGVHGAALTHSLFLRRGSVFVQVVPLGAESLAEICFERSARAMGLEYMEYKIVAEESSLVEKHEMNELPMAFQGKDWSHEAMAVYLKGQDVRLNLVRFRKYLKKAYRKARKFMAEEG